MDDEMFRYIVQHLIAGSGTSAVIVITHNSHITTLPHPLENSHVPICIVPSQCQLLHTSGARALEKNMVYYDTKKCDEGDAEKNVSRNTLP